MSWVTVLLQLIPFVIRLIPVVEKALDDKPKSGTEKKEMVMTTAKAVSDGLTAVSTGGQAETWNAIKEPVSDIIDAAVAILFPPRRSLK